MKPKKSRLRRILQILTALCAAGVLCSAFVLISDSREYAEGNAAYRQVRRIRESRESAAGRAGGGLTEKKPRAQSERVNFPALKKINPEAVAWLTAKGTKIDYPVVLGEDNSYYLRHLFTGRRNKLGAIFMDCRNHGDFSDKNTVLYGHNMKDGSMFASLTKYRRQSYYDRFPAMELDTPGGDFQIVLFAGIVVDGSRESVRFSFQDARDFQRYIDSLKKASSFKSHTAVAAGDRIITLCTCSYEFKNARYALFGKLTPATK